MSHLENQVSKRQYGVVFGLLLLVFITAVAIVYVTHSQRNLFINLQQLQQDKDDMVVEWGKLQLEENTWSTTSRIEKIATKKLDMKVPKSDDIIFIKLNH
jgi:cell division protein FtsL